MNYWSNRALCGKIINSLAMNLWIKLAADLLAQSGSVRLEEEIGGWEVLLVVEQGGSRSLLSGGGKLLRHLRC